MDKLLDFHSGTKYLDPRLEILLHGDLCNTIITVIFVYGKGILIKWAGLTRYC